MSNTSNLYEVQWNNHTKILKTTFELFRSDNELVDVTLSCEGKKLKAHKIVLSACSEYFLDLFRDNPCQHPIIILRDVKYQNIVDILNFMYLGEANVAIEHLNSFLQTAELLQVKGLADNNTDKSNKLDTSECSLVQNVDEKECKESTKVDYKTNIESTSKNLLEPTNRNIKFQSGNVSNDLTDEYKSPTQTIFKTESIDTEDINDDEFMLDDVGIQPHQHERTDYKSNSSMINILNDFASRPNSDNHGSMRKQLYPCPHCTTVFHHSISLKLHLPRHSGNTRCTVCNSVFSRKYDLKVHMRKKHNIELK